MFRKSQRSKTELGTRSFIHAPLSELIQPVSQSASPPCFRLFLPSFVRLPLSTSKEALVKAFVPSVNSTSSLISSFTNSFIFHV